MTTPARADLPREVLPLLPDPIGAGPEPGRSYDIAGWMLWSDAVDAKDRLLALARAGDLGGPPTNGFHDDLALIDTALQAFGQELTTALAVRAMCENLGALTVEHLAARVLDQIYTAAADRERATQVLGH